MDNESVKKLSTVKPFHFVQEWYDLASGDHFWMKHRFLFIKEALARVGVRQGDVLRVLDVGSGNGVVRQQIESDSNWAVDCADIDEAAVRALPHGRGENLVYNILELHREYVNRYDLVFLLDVIEHVEDPHAFIRACLQHLKPGGQLVINVPALPRLFSEYDVMAGHLRRYTKSTLNQDLSGIEHRVLYEKYWGITMVPVLIARKAVLKILRRPDQVIRVGFKPSGGIINGLLSLVLTTERLVLKARPIGTSLISIVERSDGHEV